MEADTLTNLMLDALDDLKAKDVQVLDVRGKTSVTDFMVVASGTSNRHVKALSENVLEKAKIAGVKALGMEGEVEAEWVLVDFGDVIVHVMQPSVRDFYQLEKLWNTEGIKKTGIS